MDQDPSPQILCLECKVFPATGSNFQDLVGEQWQWQYPVLFGTFLHPSPDHQGFLLVYGSMGGEHYYSLWCNSIWKINIYDTQYNMFVFQLKIYPVLTGWKFCWHVCTYTMYMIGVCGGQKREIEPMEMGPQMVLGHHGNQIWFFHENEKCCKSLSHLFGPIYVF